MLFTIITGLIGLGIVVFVHETGHFLAAKASGIEVEAFSLGWGRPLLRYTYKGTEYRLSALPIGGYCKLKGEETLQKKTDEPSDESSEKIDDEGSLFSAPSWKRILTFAAGPFSNLLFSILILSIIWWAGFSIRTYENRIILISDYTYLDPAGEKYPADAAGLQTGDRIVSIDHHTVGNYRDIQELVAERPEETIEITYERDGRKISSTITPNLNPDTGGGVIGVSAWIDPVVGSVNPGTSASAAGLKPGDRILSIEDTPVTNHLDFLSALKNHPLRFGITVRRDGETVKLRMVPDYDEQGNPRLGFSFATVDVTQQIRNPFKALTKGATESFSTLALSLKSLGLLFRGINLQKAVSGPLRITYMVGQVASYGFSQGVKTGFVSLFQFLSFLSVALFVMNLLPIPALDGGLILLSLFEMIRRRRVSPKAFYRYQVFGFVFIMALLLLTTFSDIFFFFTN